MVDISVYFQTGWPSRGKKVGRWRLVLMTAMATIRFEVRRLVGLPGDLPFADLASL